MKRMCDRCVTQHTATVVTVPSGGQTVVQRESGYGSTPPPTTLVTYGSAPPPANPMTTTTTTTETWTTTPIHPVPAPVSYGRGRAGSGGFGYASYGGPPPAS